MVFCVECVRLDLIGLHELFALLVHLSIAVLRLLPLLLALAVLVVLVDDMLMQSLRSWLLLFAFAATLPDDFDPLTAVNLLLSLL